VAPHADVSQASLALLLLAGAIAQAGTFGLGRVRLQGEAMNAACDCAEPRLGIAAVGEPRLSAWIHDDQSVHFEKGRGLHAVNHR